MRPTPTSASFRDDELSSPDPLVSSFNDENNTTSLTHGSRQSPSRTHRAAVTRDLRSNSRAASLGHIAIPSSPFRTVSEQNLSPWKIRVTVEAEPEDMDLEGPMTRTMTRTMKVPLRQDSSPLGAAMSSRGRKSQPTSSKSKRSSTPVRRQRSNSRTRRASVTDLDIRPLGDDAESDDWTKQKKKSSPRKRKSVRTRKSTTGTDAGPDSEPSPAKASRRRSSTAEFEVRQDTDAEVLDQDDGQEISLSDRGSPELRQIDLNRVSVRPRALSTKSITEDHQGINNSSSSEKPARSSMNKPIDIRKVSVNSAVSYPTPSPTSSYRGDSDDIGVGADAEDLPEAGHVGFDTVLESEGFTMIDLDTVPSARQYLSPIEDETRPENSAVEQTILSPHMSSSAVETRSESAGSAERVSETPPTIDYPTLNVDETELSSTVPSSPPASEKEKSLLRIPTSNLRKVTPITFSSPRLPSPPKQIVRRTPQHQHRGSAGAVFAGIALQDVVSPDHPSEKSSTRGKAPLSQSIEDDGIFGGFDAGTKRELRAGLRFGEELAKRQSSSPPAQTKPDNAFGKQTSLHMFEKEDIQPVTGRQPQTQIWRGETTVQRTPIQMSNPTVPKQTAFSGAFIQTPENPVSRKREQTLMDTQARREREWQLEREAISRQIQNASESQVIVINSDDDESEAAINIPGSIGTANKVNEPLAAEPISSLDDDDDNDIWLAEAKNSSSPHTQQQQPIRPTGSTLFPEAEQKKQQEICREVVSRPRRSLIPSPWKRGDDVPPPEEPSTLLSTNLEDQTGILFWDQQATRVTKFGAREVQRDQLRPRRGSGKFDIDLMVGTPRKQQDHDSRLDLTGTRLAESIQDEHTSQEIDEPDMVDQSITPSIQQEEEFQDNTNNNIGEPDAISSPEPPLRIPVHFNDSSIELSISPQTQGGHGHRPAPLQSPFKDGNTRSESSPPRPLTPRSAMKGARQTFGQDIGFKRPETPTMSRKVIFSERSRGVDIHGLESSFSMKSGSSDDSVAGQLREQLGRELLASEEAMETSHEEEQEDTSELESDQQQVHEATTVEADTVPKPSDSKSGWRSWVWGEKNKTSTESETARQSDSPSASTETKSSKPQPVTTKDDPAHHPAWTQTISSIPSTSLHRSELSSPPSSTSKPAIKLPSYLLPPSYPSDPTRSIAIPLATTGTFTNTHFRTLHIIYRKSLRPKFHAPKHIRPAVRRLLGTQMEIDETEQGIERGVMTWTLGEGECEVLERFMQEIELDYGVFPASGPGQGEARPENGNGKQQPVLWGWNVEQLAHWLCRIVVGEVVREEEARAKAKAKTMAGVVPNGKKVRGGT
jgi:hypothetical protein